MENMYRSVFEAGRSSSMERVASLKVLPVHELRVFGEKSTLNSVVLKYSG